MPTIPRSERRATINPTPLPMSGPDLSAPGKALTQLGKSFSGLFEEAQAEKDKLDDFNFRVAATQFQNDVNQDLLTSKDKIQDDGRTYLQDRLTNFDARYQDFASKFPSGKHQQQAKLLGLQMRGAASQEAYTTQRAHQQNWYTNQTQGVIQSTILPRVTGELDSAVTAGQQANGMIDSIEGLNESKRGELKRKAAELIFEQWRATADPVDARDDFEEFLANFQNQDRAATQENPETRAKPIFSQPKIEAKPEADKPARNDAIGKASQATGVPDSWLRVFAQIESGGNPKVRTGSYKGLFQLSSAEFNKHGGGDIYSPDDNALAAGHKLKSEIGSFRAKYGRDPSLTDLYLIHQQGEGGYAAHTSSPGRPAWESMYSTAEGQQKGEGWAKQAIWGNIPTDMKRRFLGGVESVTSGDFIKLWEEKVARIAKRNGAGGDVQLAESAQPVKPASVADYLREKLIEQGPALESSAHSAESQAVEKRKKELKQQSEGLEREAMQLLYDGKLDRDWLDKNEDRLDLPTYKRLSKATRGDSGFTDSELYVRLRERVDDEPAIVMQEAVDAFGKGLLNRSAFERIYTLADRDSKPETKLPSFAKEARQHIQRVVRTKVSSDQDSRKYMELMNKFDETLKQVPREKLTPEITTKIADDLIKYWETDKTASLRTTKKLPRFTRSSRQNMNEESLAAALQETDMALATKKLSQKEYEDEMKVLKQWNAILEAEMQLNAK